MILLTGATGQLGRAVINCILRSVPPNGVAALARDPARASEAAARGIEVRRGDYTDYPALVQAFEGVDKLLLVSTSALEGVVEQHSNALKAAKQAGVRHIVFTSMVNRSSAPRFRLVREYRQTEEELMRSGSLYTIMHNGYYMDMLPMFIGDALQTGVIRYPAGDGETNFTARSDLAEAVANVLTGSGHENRVYEVCAPAVYTFRDVARSLGDIAGRTIDYVDIPTTELEANLKRDRLPPLEVELMVGIAESIRASEGRSLDPSLEALLGRAPITMKEWMSRSMSSPGVDAR